MPLVCNQSASGCGYDSIPFIFMWHKRILVVTWIRLRLRKLRSLLLAKLCHADRVSTVNLIWVVPWESPHELATSQFQLQIWIPSLSRRGLKLADYSPVLSQNCLMTLDHTALVKLFEYYVEIKLFIFLPYCSEWRDTPSWRIRE